ncbi:ArsR/SmtB family transcription factor [Microbacterium sp.]|uniref:ArsR/SmtB family transcription factor n=1 Tax=Microbacterium sp. TaxID=51671 RepID=UPI003C7781B2
MRRTFGATPRDMWLPPAVRVHENHGLGEDGRVSGFGRADPLVDAACSGVASRYRDTTARTGSVRVIMVAHVDGDDTLVEGATDALEVFKALSNPVRLQILQWLRQPRENFPVERAIADPDEVGVCVTHITEKVGLAQSTVSSFMSTLERADLVVSTRVGKWTHYKRNEVKIQRLVNQLGSSL